MTQIDHISNYNQPMLFVALHLNLQTSKFAVRRLILVYLPRTLDLKFLLNDLLWNLINIYFKCRSVSDDHKLMIWDTRSIAHNKVNNNYNFKFIKKQKVKWLRISSIFSTVVGYSSLFFVLFDFRIVLPFLSVQIFVKHLMSH